MPFEAIGYRWVAERVTQVSQRPCDAIVAPAGISPGQVHHQVFESFIDLGSAWRPALLGTVSI
jgi:hypothetical protein